jgi:hypothetical protein
MTNVFQKNGIMVSRKLAKIVRIFVDIGCIKNRRIIYWPERIGLVIPTLWSGHNFGHTNVAEPNWAPQQHKKNNTPRPPHPRKQL